MKIHTTFNISPAKRPRWDLLAGLIGLLAVCLVAVSCASGSKSDEVFADTYDSYFKSFSGDYNPSPNLEDLSIGAFYEQQAEALLRYFYRRTADPDVAADLCAETFAAALENAHRYNPQRGTPAQWLYGIARNQLAMFWRRHKAGERARRRLGIPREPIDETTATELREAENLINGAEAVEALNTLPHKLRSAVVLRVVDQLGYAEIAAELGCSPGAARVRVFRGLQRLSEVLK